MTELFKIIFEIILFIIVILIIMACIHIIWFWFMEDSNKNPETINEKIEELKKGCGEKGKFDGRGFWICGLTQIDSGTYYCPLCQAKLETYQEAQKEFMEIIEKGLINNFGKLKLRLPLYDYLIDACEDDLRKELLSKLGDEK